MFICSEEQGKSSPRQTCGKLKIIKCNDFLLIKGNIYEMAVVGRGRNKMNFVPHPL
jgi:hypothetical protein